MLVTSKSYNLSAMDQNFPVLIFFFVTYEILFYILALLLVSILFALCGFTISLNKDDLTKNSLGLCDP